MSVHPEAVVIVKRFEGLRLRPYLCPAGVWTIGNGATYGLDGRRVTRDTPPIDEAGADALLARDLGRSESAVRRLVKTGLGERQIGALADFAFNLGSGALQASTLLRRVNSGDWEDVPEQFGKWVHGGGRVLPGLVVRRQCDADLWYADLLVG